MPDCISKSGRRSAGICNVYPGINPRTVQNFPIQSTRSEILHVAGVLAERRGFELVAPIHDALLADGPLSRTGRRMSSGPANLCHRNRAILLIFQ